VLPSVHSVANLTELIFEDCLDRSWMDRFNERRAQNNQASSEFDRLDRLFDREAATAWTGSCTAATTSRN